MQSLLQQIGVWESRHCCILRYEPQDYLAAAPQPIAMADSALLGIAAGREDAIPNRNRATLS